MIDHNILLRPLQQIDTSPVWAAGQNIRQDRQQAFENERQNRLEALAMQQFQETVKQNALVNARADRNAATNELNAATNAKRVEMEGEAFYEELEMTRLEADKQKLKLAFNAFGGELEAAIASMEAGQPVPEQMANKLNEGFDVAIGMFRSDMMGEALSNIKSMLPKALAENNEEGWDEVVTAMEKLSEFASAGNEMSLEDQLKLEEQAIKVQRAELGLMSDIQDLEQDALDSQQEQQDRLSSQEAGHNDLRRMLDTVNFLLTDRNYEVFSGRMASGADKGVMNPVRYLRGDRARTINAKLNNLIGMMSVDARQKMKGQGTISDREMAIFQQAETALAAANEGGIGEDGALEELQRLKSALEGRLGLSGGVELSPFTQSLLNDG